MTLEVGHGLEIARMERTLRSYGGVLTRERLFDECGADHWPAFHSFKFALEEALESGRLIALSDELIEIAPQRTA